MSDFVVKDHFLVPEHVLLPEEEKQKILVQYNASLRQFPVIRDSDPALIGLSAKPGDLILIKRKSTVTGVALSYRVVTHD